MKRVIRAGFCLLLVLLFVLPVRAQELRGLWVDAWGAGILNSTQAAQLVNYCRTYNYNAVFVQMRRRGDAFYMPQAPNLEPRTTAVAANYDALADIIAKCHTGTPRIEVHCWVVSNLIWSGANPPSQAGHVFNAHPEYLMKDYAGNTEIGEGYYLDPGNPDAMQWNYNMAKDVVSRYAIDGFHWDYIRYPQQDAGYNDVAIARYNAEYNATGKPQPSDARFAAWRRRQVTDFLRWANADLLAIKPELIISTAVFGSRTDAYNARFQDWAAWNREGIIDLCLPMNYSDNNTGVFNPRTDDAFNNQGVRRVYVGMGAYLNPKENTLTQLNYVRGKGLLGHVMYSYRVPNSGTVNQTATFTHLRNNFQPTWQTPPELPWKVSPTKGIARGTVTRRDNGAPIYNATVTIQTAPNRLLRTEAHGKFAFFETTPGTYTVSVSAPGLGTTNGTVTVTAGGNTIVNLVVPVNDTTAPQIASVTVTNLTDQSATIVWSTDELADSRVEYGTTLAYGQTVTNDTDTLNHEVVLSGLMASTTYHFRVKSRDVSNNEATSADFTVITNPDGIVNDIIMDNPAATFVGTWTSGTSATDKYGSDYRFTGQGSGAAYAEFRPQILTAGAYDVFAWHPQGSNRSAGTPHVIAHQNGSTPIAVNQQVNGGRWVELGRFNFAQGASGYVRITDGFADTGKVAMADAVKFVYVPPVLPPEITTAPESLAAYVGQDVTLSVVATGTAPLSYQWQFDNANLTGQTNATLTLASITTTNAGEYRVVVTNAVGAAVSEVATLTVLVPVVPEIAELDLISDGQLRLRLSGEPAGQYVVEISTDLIEWADAATLDGSAGVVEFFDTIPEATEQRFYRVRWEP